MVLDGGMNEGTKNNTNMMEMMRVTQMEIMLVKEMDDGDSDWI